LAVETDGLGDKYEISLFNFQLIFLKIVVYNE
jgi:hypothetical protein